MLLFLIHKYGVSSQSLVFFSFINVQFSKLLLGLKISNFDATTNVP